MKLDFNIKPPAVGGEEIKTTLAEVLAVELLRSSSQKEDEILKFFSWGMALTKGEVIDLDKADQKKLSELIVSSKQLTNFLKGNLLEVVENGKHDNEDSK